MYPVSTGRVPTCTGYNCTLVQIGQLIKSVNKSNKSVNLVAPLLVLLGLPHVVLALLLLASSIASTTAS